MFQYSVIKWVYSLRILPRWVIILIDLTFIACSAVIGYLLRFNFDLPEIQRNNFVSGVFLTMACGLIAIMMSGSHQGIIRYTGLQVGEILCAQDITRYGLGRIVLHHGNVFVCRRMEDYTRFMTM